MSTAPTTSTDRPQTVAIVGFGTVGTSVARILCARDDGALRLAQVCNRDVGRKRVDWAPSDVRWTDRFDDVLESDVDCVVELIGGLEPAGDWIARALAAGKSVVTANKQVIAHRGPELVELARRQGVTLRFEASVAGGIPIVNGLQQGLAGDRLVRVLGILNGTCNYILTRMESAGVGFSSALEEAQTKGFAEADPTDDVEGIDAQAKLAILCAVGLRRHVDPGAVVRRGITEVEPVDFVYASRLDCVIRQVAWAELGDDDQPRMATVQPSLVPRASALARVEGSRNVVLVEGEFGGETAFVGQGAGGNPTAVAVVSDLLALSRMRAPALPFAAGSTVRAVSNDLPTRHYLRFLVTDRSGIIAALAEVVSRHGINVEAVLQEPGFPRDRLPFVMTLDACDAAAVAAALDDMSSLDFHVRPPVWMPIVE